VFNRRAHSNLRQHGIMTQIVRHKPLRTLTITSESFLCRSARLIICSPSTLQVLVKKIVHCLCTVMPNCFDLSGLKFFFTFFIVQGRLMADRMEDLEET
jgi:hypothetical protein